MENFKRFDQIFKKYLPLDMTEMIWKYYLDDDEKIKYLLNNVGYTDFSCYNMTGYNITLSNNCYFKLNNEAKKKIEKLFRSSLKKMNDLYYKKSIAVNIYYYKKWEINAR